MLQPCFLSSTSRLNVNVHANISIRMHVYTHNPLCIFFFYLWDRLVKKNSGHVMQSLFLHGNGDGRMLMSSYLELYETTTYLHFLFVRFFNLVLFFKEAQQYEPY